MTANYPVHNARQVEIVYGPASALYGADAFSAVINIISKDVGESPGLAVGIVGRPVRALQPDGVLRRPAGRERDPDALGPVPLRPPARSQPLLPGCLRRSAGTAQRSLQHDLRADDGRAGPSRRPTTSRHRPTRCRRASRRADSTCRCSRTARARRQPLRIRRTTRSTTQRHSTKTTCSSPREATHGGSAASRAPPR